MVSYNDYIGSSLRGRHLHIKCDCIVSLDVTGVCVGYKTSGSELIIELMDDDTHKIIPIGSNTHNLMIEDV